MTLLIVAIFIIVPAMCVFFTLTTNRFYDRHHRATMTAREKNAHIRENILDIRERAVTQKEQDLRRTAKEAAASIHMQEARYDTAISVLPWSTPAERFENADTVSMPVVEE